MGGKQKLSCNSVKKTWVNKEPFS